MCDGINMGFEKFEESEDMEIQCTLTRRFGVIDSVKFITKVKDTNIKDNVRWYLRDNFDKIIGDRKNKLIYIILKNKKVVCIKEFIARDENDRIISKTLDLTDFEDNSNSA